MKWPRLLLVCVVLLGACKASEAPSSEFLDRPDQLARHDTKPFHGWWANRDAAWGTLREVFVSKVDLSHLRSGWDGKVHSAAASNPSEGAREMGRYLRARLQAEFAEDEERRFRLVNTPGPETLVVELALVELVPTRNLLNLVGYATLMMSFDWGTTALEGQVRVAMGGPVIAKFKDREYGQIALFSFADLRWYAHAKHTIDTWAQQLVDCLKDRDVPNTSAFTLRAW